MLNKKLKKVIASVTMFATVLCFSSVSMLALPLSAQAATAIVDGDIVKTNAINSDGTPSISSLDVYIVKTVGSKKFKRLVLNPNIFASYSHLKWENLKTVSQAEIDVYTTSSLVRVDGNDKVYAITPVTGGDTGAKSWINLTAAQFLSLTPSDPDSIYTINATDGAAYSAKVDITTVAQLTAFYATGALPDETPVITSDLTVSLSVATPEVMSIPTDSSAEFTAIKLAAGSSAVSINSLTVTASGLGDPNDLDNVALYIDGSKVGTSKDINEREAIFNFSTPIKINANASKTLTIKATANNAGNFKLGLKEAADVITASGTVAGSFPIYGNTMSADVVAGLGNVTLTASAGTSTNSFGEDNVLLADFSLKANNEAVLVESLRLKNGGTNDTDIISNLKLFADGEDIADGVYDSATGYVTFSINGNFKIKEDDTVAFEVYGDLGVASLDNTVALYIKNADDFVMVGEDYGFGIGFKVDSTDPTILGITALDTIAKGVVVTLAAGAFTIDMDKAATPAKDIKSDTTDVVLATLKLTSSGENATVNSITDTGAANHNFEIRGTGIDDGDLSNIEMKDTTTGSIYELTSVFAAGTYTLVLDEEINLTKGVTKTFEIRADVTDATDENTTFNVVLEKNALSITGDESDSAITDITPASGVTSSISTVKAASLTWTTNSLIAKTVVPGTKDVVLYQASLEAGSVDDVKLSTVKLTTHANAIDDFNDTNISSLDLYLNGVKIKSIDGDIVEGTAGTEGTVTFNSLTTTNKANEIKAGTTATLEVKAGFASSLTHVASFGLEIHDGVADISVKDAVDNANIIESVTNALTASRTITVASQGALKVELLTADAAKIKDSVLLAGTANVAGKYLGELKFTTASEKIKVTELRLQDTGSAESSSIAEVQLVDASGAVKASKIPATNGDVVFTGLNLELVADQATSYYIAVKAKGMNVNGDAASTAVQGVTSIYNINATAGVVAKGVDSGLDVTIIANGATTTLTAATGTLTMADAACVADETYTVTINGTAVPYTALIADCSGTDAADTIAILAKIATAIDANVTVGPLVNAAATANTITITAVTAGVAGNLITTVAADISTAQVLLATHGTLLGGIAANSVVPAAGEWSNASVLSKTTFISGSVLNSITNAMTDGTLTPGVKNTIAKYTFTFENGSNRTTTNDELKAILKNLTLTYTGSNLGAMASVSAYIEGTSVEAASVSVGSPLSWTNLDTLSNSGKVDGPVTIVVTATPAVTSATAAATMQTTLTTATGIQYIGAGEGSTVNPNNYLTDTTITGGTLRYSA